MDKDDDEPIYGVDFWPATYICGRDFKTPARVFRDATGNKVIICDLAPSYFEKLARRAKKREAEQSDALD